MKNRADVAYPGYTYYFSSHTILFWNSFFCTKYFVLSYSIDVVSTLSYYTTCYGCWFLDNARKQAINSHGVDQILWNRECSQPQNTKALTACDERSVSIEDSNGPCLHPGAPVLSPLDGTSHGWSISLLLPISDGVDGLGFNVSKYNTTGMLLLGPLCYGGWGNCKGALRWVLPRFLLSLIIAHACGKVTPAVD